MLKISIRFCRFILSNIRKESCLLTHVEIVNLFTHVKIVTFLNALYHQAIVDYKNVALMYTGSKAYHLITPFLQENKFPADFDASRIGNMWNANSKVAKSFLIKFSPTFFPSNPKGAMQKLKIEKFFKFAKTSFSSKRIRALFEDQKRLHGGKKVLSLFCNHLLQPPICN